MPYFQRRQLMIKKAIQFILTFIGASILFAFHYTRNIISWIGALVFFTYVITILFPLEIIFKFEKFRSNPREFARKSFKDYKQFVIDIIF